MTEPSGWPTPVDPEIVFRAIEDALVTEARKHYGEVSNINVTVSRLNASLTATCNGIPIDPEEMIRLIGDVTAKQAIIRKIREAQNNG